LLSLVKGRVYAAIHNDFLWVSFTPKDIAMTNFVLRLLSAAKRIALHNEWMLFPSIFPLKMFQISFAVYLLIPAWQKLPWMIDHFSSSFGATSSFVLEVRSRLDYDGRWKHGCLKIDDGTTDYQLRPFPFDDSKAHRGFSAQTLYS